MATSAPGASPPGGEEPIEKKKKQKHKARFADSVDVRPHYREEPEEEPDEIIEGVAELRIKFQKILWLPDYAPEDVDEVSVEVKVGSASSKVRCKEGEEVFLTLQDEGDDPRLEVRFTEAEEEQVGEISILLDELEVEAAVTNVLTLEITRNFWHQPQQVGSLRLEFQVEEKELPTTIECSEPQELEAMLKEKEKELDEMQKDFQAAEEKAKEDFQTELKQKDQGISRLQRQLSATYLTDNLGFPAATSITTFHSANEAEKVLASKSMLVTVMDAHHINTTESTFMKVSYADEARRTRESVSDDLRHPVWNQNLVFKLDGTTEDKMTFALTEKSGKVIGRSEVKLSSLTSGDDHKGAIDWTSLLAHPEQPGISAGSLRLLFDIVSKEDAVRCESPPPGPMGTDPALLGQMLRAVRQELRKTKRKIEEEAARLAEEKVKEEERAKVEEGLLAETWSLHSLMMGEPRCAAAASLVALEQHSAFTYGAVYGEGGKMNSFLHNYTHLIYHLLQCNDTRSVHSHFWWASYGLHFIELLCSSHQTSSTPHTHLQRGHSTYTLLDWDPRLLPSSEEKMPISSPLWDPSNIYIYPFPFEPASPSLPAEGREQGEGARTPSTAALRFVLRYIFTMVNSSFMKAMRCTFNSLKEHTSQLVAQISENLIEAETQTNAKLVQIPFDQDNLPWRSNLFKAWASCAVGVEEAKGITALKTSCLELLRQMTDVTIVNCMLDQASSCSRATMGIHMKATAYWSEGVLAGLFPPNEGGSPSPRFQNGASEGGTSRDHVRLNRTRQLCDLLMLGKDQIADPSYRREICPELTDRQLAYMLRFYHANPRVHPGDSSREAVDWTRTVATPALSPEECHCPIEWATFHMNRTSPHFHESLSLETLRKVRNGLDAQDPPSKSSDKPLTFVPSKLAAAPLVSPMPIFQRDSEDFAKVEQ